MRLRLAVAAVFFAAVFSAGAAAGDEGGFFGFFRKHSAEAQYKIGSEYYLGGLVKRDLDAAAAWWRRAAENGHAKAQHNMGVLYYRGEGVVRDYAEAAKWHGLAAEQGFLRSQHNLGMFYRAGEGVPRDNHMAYVWLSLAAERGYDKSIKFRKEVAENFSSKELSAAQAEAVRRRREIQARVGARGRQ